MKSLLFTFLIACIGCVANAQGHPKVNALVDEAEKGDGKAIDELIKLTGSKQHVTFNIGRHLRKGVLGKVAYNRLLGLLSFTAEEIVVNRNDKTGFVKWLKTVRQKLIFDPTYKLWLITPIEKRTAEFIVKPLDPSKFYSDSTNNYKYFKILGFSKAKLDSMVALKDPAIFAVLAPALLRNRDYIGNTNDIAFFFTLLTKIDIRVKDYAGNWVDNFSFDYYDCALHNYTLFWLNNYKDFVWDADKQLFVNPKLELTPLDPAENYMSLLNNPVDSIAMEAFIKLTDNTADVKLTLATGAERVNKALPIFWQSFLKSISNIKKYNTDNLFTNVMPKLIEADAKKLLKQIPFKERYALENKLVQNLTLEDVGAFEVFMLYNEETEDAQFSAGRILDIFYSKHWKEITANPRYLECYLKKAVEMDKLSIIGSCNQYKYKFSNSSPKTIKLLWEIESSTTDPDIKALIKEIIDKHNTYQSNKILKPYTPDHTYTTREAALKAWNEALNKGGSDISFEGNLLSVLYHLDFKLIPLGVELIDTVHLKYYEKNKYNFIINDYGIPVDGIANDSIRLLFLQNFKNLSVKNLYAHYIRQCGYDIWDSTGAVDYKKAYWVLKYDFPEPLTGSGTYRGFGIFGIIKLLEAELGTTLDFPARSSDMVTNFSGNLVHHARAWRNYLIKNKHIPAGLDNEPISFLQDPFSD